MAALLILLLTTIAIASASASASAIAIASSSTIHDEMQALLELKASLEDPMGNLDGWRVQLRPHQSSGAGAGYGDGGGSNATEEAPEAGAHGTAMVINYTASPCAWNGVLCRRSTGGGGGGGRRSHSQKSQESHGYGDGELAVISLDLSAMNLSGTISAAAIRSLRRLESFAIASNNITGRLPAAELLFSISSLLYLNVSNNLLSGELLLLHSHSHSHGDGAERNRSDSPLQVLDAYNNNLHGQLPEELASSSTFPELRHLHLGGNYFNGSIPAQMGSMQSLEYLALSGNSLSGEIPPGIGGLAKLRELYLGYYNEFEGGIPSSLGELAELEVLDMAECGLEGPIPAELFRNLPRLRSLFLFTNSLSGPIPAISSPRLQLLDLSNNLLSGPIPASIGSLAGLELLHLFRNRIGGSIPGSVASLPSLRVLSLWENRIGGSVPRQLGSANRNLVYVDLSSNLLAGAVPPGICAGGELRALILFGNSFRGPLPESLSSRCSRLQRLRVGRNRLSGSIPARLLELPRLQTIEMQSNELRGSIPAAAAAAAGSLGRLDLSRNLLEGAIPASIGSLPALESLLLGGNKLGGSLPRELGSLRRLSKLDLSSNRIEGPIPAELASCSSLTSLDLSSNRLRGSIPPQLRDLPVLDFLNLSRNRLAGPIPSSLQQMQTLTAADFSYNNLSGPIPAGGQFAALNASSFVGNPGLCGAPLLPDSPCNNDSSSSSSNGGINHNGGDASIASRTSRRGTEIVYWAVVGLMSALTFSVLLASIFYYYLTHGMLLRSFIGFSVGSCSRASSSSSSSSTSSSTSSPPWKLVAFQKVDFGASHVQACLTEENVIGKGRSGTVYRCKTPSGYVAVKKLPPITTTTIARSGKKSSSKKKTKKMKMKMKIKPGGGGGGGGGDHGGAAMAAEAMAMAMASSSSSSSSSSSRDEDDDHGFSAEIETLGKIRHRNIVKLLGFCSSGGKANNNTNNNTNNNFLVYEFMPNGSLGELLHGPKAGSALDWALRYKIALEAAHGLRYLHHDCSPRIVHRDVKSKNILLDSSFEAHVADFGLAKVLHDNTRSGLGDKGLESMTSVAGSYGYIAPEYVYTLTVDEKSDIYSFGTVLLELMTGRRPVEPEFGEEGANLVQWVRSKVKSVGRQDRHGMLQVIDSILDPRLAPALLSEEALQQQQQQQQHHHHQHQHQHQQLQQKHQQHQQLQQQQALVLLHVALRCVSDLPAQRPSMNEVVQILSDHSPNESSAASSARSWRNMGSHCITADAISSSQPPPCPPSSSTLHHLRSTSTSSSTDLDAIHSAKSTDALLGSSSPTNPPADSFFSTHI